MHTVEQAKTLWCPMARVAACRQGEDDSKSVRDGQTVFNRLQDENGQTGVVRSGCCIADQCAMWRWAGKKEMAAGKRSNSRGEIVDSTIPSIHNTGLGYCGLAGRPEVMG